MTDDERIDAQLDAMRAWEDHHDRTLYGCHEDCALEAHDALMNWLDEHQPLTAKLMREGDPEGAVADILLFGLDQEMISSAEDAIDLGYQPVWTINDFINRPGKG